MAENAADFADWQIMQYASEMFHLHASYLTSPRTAYFLLLESIFAV